jgi:uncharacterized protein YlxW (UPF0749 family)
MSRRNVAAYPLLAVAALLFGFLLASQLRLNVIPQGNRVARNAALVRSVQQLEQENANDRGQLQRLNSDIARLEQEAAKRSAAAQQLEDQLNDVRAHAGLTRLHGPGVTVTLANGNAVSTPGSTSNLVTFQDIQDVVNLLYSAGAEGIAVNGQRLTPMSAFKGSGEEVVIDQGPPTSAPFRISAVGDRNAMQDALNDSANLGDLRHRQGVNQAQLSWNGEPDVTLPAYDGDLQVTYARAT